MSEQVAGYSAMSKTYHWLVVILVFTTVPIGITMATIGPGDLQNTLYFYHESIGVLIFVLVVLRLIQRWITPPPPVPASLPAGLRILSATVHWALYLFLIVNPLIGWYGVSLFGAQVPFFDFFNLPSIAAQDQTAANNVLLLHAAIGLFITFLVLLHICGAFYHWLIRKDGIFDRMTTAPYQRSED
ncbi:cytochrome b [Pseudovibrio japonicus]|uniref:Cytochrome b n=1 Tax=Pseudovibrio japonicus TaxID=366534 RepID=A0ABQ3E3W0_9HYPH|nr:cytochrome b/b6 domain-containing protein [Pseudovibrio japonicus]GHB23971.1 cytochrome b [Pseudovibrio japonicus]